MSDLSIFKDQNKFLLLAFDHRGSFKKLINPENPDTVSDEEAINLKREIIESVYDQVSGVLIDVEIGREAYKGFDKPFLLPLERSGYTDIAGERIAELEYTAKQLRDKGAKGAKILLYFNPYVNSAQEQLTIARKVVDDCKQAKFPLFLEIRVYKPESGDDLGGESESLVINSLELFIENNIIPDVWKLEYPGSIAGCQRVTRIAGETPWILLTRGVGFDEFVSQLEDAMKSGCKGFLAGRALWQEVCGLTGEERVRFLKKILPDRFRKIKDVALYADDISKV